jgi:tetratricopeptide (TPR) repeat protein
VASDETDTQGSPNDASSAAASSEEWIAVASRYALEEWWCEAAEAFQRALDLDPDSAPLWARYGDALFQSRQPVAAAQAFIRALTLAGSTVELPHVPKVPQVTSAPEPAAGSIEEQTAALTALDLGLRLFPENAMYWVWRGDALAHLDRSDEALQAYEQALARGAPSGFVRDAQGRILLERGQYAQALDAFQQASGSNSPETWDGCGQALLALDRYEEASVSFERAIALAPQYGRAWRHLAQVRRAQGYVEVAEDLERHSRTFPNDDTAIPF